MRNFVRPLILSAALLFVVGCGSTTTQTNVNVVEPEYPESYQMYTSADGWSIRYPDTWSVDDTNYETSGVVHFGAPSQSQSFRGNLGVTKTDTEFTADMIDYEDLRSAIKEALETSGATNVETSVVQLPAGEAVRGDTQFSREGLSFGVTQVQIYRDYTGFVLTYMADTDEFGEFKTDAELMMQSFKPAVQE